ncbi:hypothetical protein AAHA92_30721 [Salvia divinorum]|uniref:Uncharacterized protein n=1 Tax=Salvia divinorum TaxID=28513 RepID=A0ABD1FRS6_SALDI
MAKTLHIFLASFALYASLLHSTLAAKIIVTNDASTTPGGIRFDREIGAAFTIATEQSIIEFIWKLFRQNTAADRKNVPVLNVVLKRIDDDTLAETGGDNIYVNDNGILSFGDAKFDFTALILRKGFTVDLNNKMREVYKDEYFLEMLGKPLDQVWKEYKAKYAR